MSDYDDKFLGPVFPTRHSTPQGGSTERQMLDSVHGAGAIRTKIRANADGTETTLRTRAGMPHFETTAAKKSGDLPLYHGGIAGEIRSDGEVDGKSAIYKLTTDTVIAGKTCPTVVAYALTLAGGGYSYPVTGGVKAVWTKGNFAASRDMHEWAAVSTATITDPDDSYHIPFQFGKEKRVASDTHIWNKDGTVAYLYDRPWRTVNAEVGPRQYDKLPPLVSHDQSKAVLQSSDSQLFLDTAYGVPTELTRLYDGVVFDAETETTSVFSTSLFTGIPVPPSVVDVSNSDGEEISQSYPCVAHRPWWDSLNPDGTGKPDPWPVIVTTISGSVDTIPPARADYTGSLIYDYSGNVPFTKTVFGNYVIDAEYRLSAGLVSSTDIVQRYFQNGMGDPFSDAYRFNPYYVRMGQSMENCSIHTKESVDLTAEVKVGTETYPIFRAIGKSSCDGDKFNHDATEGVHPIFGLYWPGDPGYDGGSLWPALEAACGYSVGEMQTWSGPGLGGGWTADITKSNHETDRIEHLEYEATGCYHLAADATLGFNAYLEFSFKYSVDLNSATFDSTWKWKIPRYIPPVTISAEVNFVVKHKGVTQKTNLFVGSITKRPELITVPYGNPYYFVLLHYGGPAIAAEIAAHDADIIWVHKLPSSIPQPSWFNSLDTIVRQQQTSPYLAGFSSEEITHAQAENSRFPTPTVDLIFSRRINMREAGADWLFKAHKLDDPLTSGGRAYGYNDELYSLICEKTWRFEFDSVKGLNFWTDTVSENTGNSETDRYANCFRV